MTPEQEDPRSQNATDFPTDGPLEEKLRFLVAYACLAPSAYNAQPWLFGTGPNWIDVLADLTRARPVVDPFDREMTIGCGAAIETLLIAARRFSLQPTVTLSPDAGCRHHLAQISFAEGAVPDAQETTLFEAITDRRTDHSHYYMEAVPDDLISECRTITDELGISFQPVDGASEMEALAGLVEKANRLQTKDPHFQRELESWRSDSREESRDGMLTRPATKEDVEALHDPAYAGQKTILAGSPLFGFFASKSDSTEDWVNTGRALARVLLLLTSRGYTASFLNQPIQVDVLREDFRKAASLKGFPQLMLRIGKSTQRPKPSLRRSLSEVLVTI